MRIDPFTGHSSLLDWPEYPGLDAWAVDNDIDPATRELRFVGFAGRNLRFGLDDLTFVEDEPFDLEGSVHALAHVPPGAGDAGRETFAIVFSSFPGAYSLARIGGPQGIPPASSGEVTLIGELAIQGDVRGFDISASGAAYFTTFEYVGAGFGGKNVNRLYHVDLASAAVEELGIIASPGAYTFVTGIAVAPEGLGQTILEVPSLSGVGAAAFGTVLALLGFWRIARQRAVG